MRLGLKNHHQTIRSAVANKQFHARLGDFRGLQFCLTTPRNGLGPFATLTMLHVRPFQTLSIDFGRPLYSEKSPGYAT